MKLNSQCEQWAKKIPKSQDTKISYLKMCWTESDLFILINVIDNLVIVIVRISVIYSIFNDTEKLLVSFTNTEKVQQ